MSDLTDRRFPPLHEPRAMQAMGFQHRNGGAESGDNEIGQSIPQRFASVGGLYGDKIALAGVNNHESVIHASLFEQMAKVVADLNNLGIGRGDRVALVMPDGLQMAISFLGLSAGATCAPLNPALPVAEFESIFDDLAPRALAVASGSDYAAVTAARTKSIPIIEFRSVGENGSLRLEVHGDRLGPTARTGFASAADAGLILFTSGTTARPKLVPLTHANLLASAGNIAATLELSPQDRCLNVMPLFHIHGLIGGLLASLVSGGSVICPPAFVAGEFFTWLEQFKPTWYTAVPAMHQGILAQAHDQAETIRRYPLRFIRSSSSPLPASVMAELESVFHAPVIESYGMTEASHQIASNPLPPGRRKTGSVGKAAGPEIAIMDEGNRLQSAGAVGEVVIRGANVMQGYAENLAANAAAFTQGSFRTGDQGYLDGDGYLFLTGRIKELINRGGEKISPREIDDVLLAHAAVAQAATFAVPHPTLGEEVAAAVVLRPHRHATPAELGEFVTTRVADFKTPKQIIIVDEIPRSATGKLQRVELADRLASQLRAAARPPETQLESMVEAIYAAVLGVEAVGTTENFFALGGDSLRATQIINRVRAALDVTLSMAAIFRNPTVSELSAEIVRMLADTDGDLTSGFKSSVEES